jgi:hypothetical protein
VSAVPEVVGEYIAECRTKGLEVSEPLSWEEARRERNRATSRAWRARKRALTQNEPSPQPTLEPVDDLLAAALVRDLPLEQRREYELSGVTAITVGGVSLADEDHDPAPVPTGCASCWRGPGSVYGSVCRRCPDPASKARLRLERRRGLGSRS